MRADRLEQVFLQHKAGVYEALLVFESPAGARERVRLTAPVGDDVAAVDFVARYLGLQGAGLARRPRLRVASVGGGLRDAPELLERLRTAVGRQRAARGDED